MTTPAERIVTKFGGVRAMSRLMTEAGDEPVPITTVQYWKTSGRIPGARQQQVLEAAAFHGIAVSPADFFAIPKTKAS